MSFSIEEGQIHVVKRCHIVPIDGTDTYVEFYEAFTYDKDKQTGTVETTSCGRYEDEALTIPYPNTDPAQDCPDYEAICVESQEWTYALDNTGTRFSDTASYEITLSDGTTLTFDQTPTAGWSQQLNQWAAEIQSAADNAGLIWFAESRFINNSDPTSTAGGGGLPGPPSANLGQKLFDNGMAWRYVNIQICPGQPVPVRMVRTASTTYGDEPFDLATAGACLGPVNKYQICQACNAPTLWFREDGTTLLPEGERPNCWEPCGTLALLPAPPDRTCTFVTEIGCDQDAADPTNQITRRATFCDGEQIALDFFEADPADPTALIPYTMVGAFVDCDSGVPVEDPEPPINEYRLIHTGCIEVDGTKMAGYSLLDGNGQLVSGPHLDSVAGFCDTECCDCEDDKFAEAGTSPEGRLKFDVNPASVSVETMRTAKINIDMPEGCEDYCLEFAPDEAMNIGSADNGDPFVLNFVDLFNTLPAPFSARPFGLDGEAKNSILCFTVPTGLGDISLNIEFPGGGSSTWVSTWDDTAGTFNVVDDANQNFTGGSVALCN